jgi:sugar lactone lactonase YvrE
MSRSRLSLSCIVDSRCNLGEAPLWSASEEKLYWLDISLSSTLFIWHSTTRKVSFLPLNELATGLALSSLDDLIVVSENGPSIFELSEQKLLSLSMLPFSMHGRRFNDCGCDPAGRLWTGTMANELQPLPGQSQCTGELYRFDEDMSCHLMREGIGCPNTFVWAGDSKSMYSADSSDGCIYAYQFDLDSGSLGGRKVFANPSGLGLPDGSAIDAEGYIWNARWGAGCVARFAPDGTIDQTVVVPADHVTSCAFGGPHLQTLFVTTARQHHGRSAVAHQPLAGGVFAFEPKVPGVPVPAFRINCNRRNSIRG